MRVKITWPEDLRAIDRDHRAGHAVVINVQRVLRVGIQHSESVADRLRLAGQARVCRWAECVPGTDCQAARGSGERGRRRRGLRKRACCCKTEHRGKQYQLQQASVHACFAFHVPSSRNRKLSESAAVRSHTLLRNVGRSFPGSAVVMFDNNSCESSLPRIGCVKNKKLSKAGEGGPYLNTKHDISQQKKFILLFSLPIH